MRAPAQLTADGTTLGADNGIGIAAMMALAEDDAAPHGPLELLMTVVEEVGIAGEGANGLDPSLVSGSILLNLDSEEDGKLTVGSASSTDTSIRVERPREACLPGAVTLSVVLSGGLGGHSGTDIARGRANAIKVLARALRETLAASRSGSSPSTAAGAGTRSRARRRGLLAAAERQAPSAPPSTPRPTPSGTRTRAPTRTWP